MKQTIINHFAGDFSRLYCAELEGVKNGNGDERTALCCFHDDHAQSLSFNAKTGVFFCHACGAKGDIFDFIKRKHGCANFFETCRAIGARFGIELPEYDPESKGNGKPFHHFQLGEPLEKYSYTDENERILYYSCRFEPKAFRQCNPDGRTWSVNGTRKVPYRLQKVLVAEEVFVVEGEKDVHSLEKIGLTGTCNVAGAGKWLSDYNDHFRGKRVVILPDNDKPGRDHARKVAESLHGIARSVKIVELPELPEKGDVSDFLQAYGDVDEALERLSMFVDGAEEFKPGPQEDSGEACQIEEFPLSKPFDVSLCFEVTPRPMPFFAKDRMPAGRGVLITGLGGSSKTRLLYHLALGAVVGRLPFDWEIGRTGKAVLLLTEDTSDDVHRTLFFLVRRLDLTDSEKILVAENLFVFPLADSDCKLLVKTPTGSVERSPLLDELVEKINGYGDVVFVGIDPALSVTEGDELDQGHQRELGRMIDRLAIRTGATAALVSHATKASLNAAELSSHNSRGGGAITDAVRAEYSLRNMTQLEAARAGIEDMEERRRHVQLVATKGNSLPPSAFVPVWLRRDDSGALFEADVCLDGVALSQRDRDIAGVLSEMGASPIAAWRDRCVELGFVSGPTDDAKTRSMDRVRGKLKKAGLITKGSGKGVWIPVSDDRHPQVQKDTPI